MNKSCPFSPNFDIHMLLSLTVSHLLLLIVGYINKFLEDKPANKDNELPQFSKILQRILEFRKESGKLPTGGSKRFGIDKDTNQQIEAIVSDPNLWIEQFSKGDKFVKVIYQPNNVLH